MEGGGGGRRGAGGPTQMLQVREGALASGVVWREGEREAGAGGASSLGHHGMGRGEEWVGFHSPGGVDQERGECECHPLWGVRARCTWLLALEGTYPSRFHWGPLTVPRTPGGEV